MRLPSGKKYEQVVRPLPVLTQPQVRSPSTFIVKIWSHAYGGAGRLEDEARAVDREVRLGVLAAEQVSCRTFARCDSLGRRHRPGWRCDGARLRRAGLARHDHHGDGDHGEETEGREANPARTERLLRRRLLWTLTRYHLT